MKPKLLTVRNKLGRFVYGGHYGRKKTVKYQICPICKKKTENIYYKRGIYSCCSWNCVVKLKLNKYKMNPNGRNWTEQQKKFLKNNYYKKSAKWIANKMDKSISNIITMAHNFGMKKYGESVNNKCLKCGKLFIIPFNKKSQRFCSQKCSFSCKAENTYEKYVRKILDGLKIKYIQEQKFGKYFVDFYIPGKKFVLEVDGSYWHSSDKVKRKDKLKDEFLMSKGLIVRHLVMSSAFLSRRNISDLKAVLYP